jgi:DNA polymerase-3 subunit epsilon
MGFDTIAFDLETTGIDPFTDVPVSWALGNKTGLINPCRPIPEGASAIHGITDDMVVNAEPLVNSIFMLRDALENYWQIGKIIIGMNVSYDLTMVQSVCQRFGTFLVVGPVFDVLVIDRHFDKYRKGSRNLTNLCKHYGIVLENAHTSEADANACTLILDKQIEMYPKLQYLPAKDNEVMRQWHQEWLTNFSAYQVKNGNNPVPKGRYAWPIHSKEM